MSQSILHERVMAEEEQNTRHKVPLNHVMPELFPSQLSSCRLGRVPWAGT